MENEIKDVNSDVNTDPLFQSQQVGNLLNLIKDNTPTPTYIPKNFIECFYSRKTGEFYVYTNNAWKELGGSVSAGATLPDATSNTNKLFRLTTTDTVYFSNGSVWISLN